MYSLSVHPRSHRTGRAPVPRPAYPILIPSGPDSVGLQTHSSNSLATTVDNRLQFQQLIPEICLESSSFQQIISDIRKQEPTYMNSLSCFYRSIDGGNN